MPFHFALPVAALVAVAGTPTAAAAAQPSSPDWVLEAQILLDRHHHSPGVIDGRQGSNTRRAVRAFETAEGLPADGMLDAEVMKRLRASSSEPLLTDYRVTEEDVSKLVDVPDGMEAQAKLDHLGFESAAEALAEKFHMSQALLKRLNLGANFAVGESIRVVRPGKDELESKVARIEVDKGRSEVRAFSDNGKLLASYPGTIGSDRFPSPDGSMEVRAVAPAPTYYFDPSGRDWGPDQRLTIAAGPNNPVGGTWIDLTKDGYGIHGSPDPRLIGKTASHGCVRLTNWDAAELGGAVKPGTVVIFT
ncbi:L,D-transpeptidase [Sphingomonas swuensis]|uniref:L,D-transpeptidase n=1 Tax=Sphingomonas swuensis TaxID=977800 RepID=A0ABP7SM14_9SPHN